ncbi:hypothetical protein Tcan_14008 [Toxocara canis]|uniref:Uncharacterized protein n=1 Tax=Toxocara canis TaxID=6265 RepID=A0A0B2VS20_TOXCA|nr:hypothetical protein Tcan_14008 [Toxocara canis]
MHDRGLRRDVPASSESLRSISKTESRFAGASEAQQPISVKGGEFLELNNSNDENNESLLSDRTYYMEPISVAGDGATVDSTNQNQLKPESRATFKEAYVNKDAKFPQYRNNDSPAPDIFGGVQSRWRPESEALKKRFTSATATPNISSRRAPQKDLGHIPISGYSGHMPGMREREVGKNFTAAAKECWERYNETRQGDQNE